MIAGPAYTRDMGEGGRLHAMAARVPTLGLPEPPPPPAPTPSSHHHPHHHHFGKDANTTSPPYDLNKNSLISRKEKSSSLRHGGGGASTHPHLQPFTAPWLSEVARITPVQPQPHDHVAFSRASLHVPPASHSDYYQQYSRSSLYHHTYLPHPYIRDYSRASLRPYHHTSPLDPRLPPDTHTTHTSSAPIRPLPTVNPRGLDLDLVSSRPSLAAPVPVPLVRPLGPPPPPSVSIESSRDPRDYRDTREIRDVPQDKNRLRLPELVLPTSLPGASSGDHSPRASPNRKRHSDTTSFPLPSPKSPRTQNKTREVSQIKEEPKQESRADSPYHPHFRRGALVTVGGEVIRVEEMKTQDFVAAANASSHLCLDPSKVSAIITPAKSNVLTTITFNFPSRNQEVWFFNITLYLILLILLLPVSVDI